MTRTKKINQPQTTAQSLSGIIKSARDIMRKDKGLSGDADRLPMLTWIMFLKFLDDHERVREDEALLANKRFMPVIEAPYRWRDWAAVADGITGDELIAFINQERATRPDGTTGLGLFAYLKNLQGTSTHDRRDTISSVFRGTVNRMINGYLLRDVLNRLEAIHFNSSEELHVLSRTYETLLKEMRDAAGDAGEFYTPRPVVKMMVDLINPKLGETVLDPACGTGGFLVEAYAHLETQCASVKDRLTLQASSIQGCEAKPLPFLLANMNLLLHGLDAPDIDSGNALRFPLNEITAAQKVDVVLTNPPFGGEEEKGILSNFPLDKQSKETTLLFLQLVMKKLKKDGRAAIIVPNTTMFQPGIAGEIRRELIGYGLHTVLRLPKGVFEPYTDIETNILFVDKAKQRDSVLFFHHVPPDGRKQYSKTQPMLYHELGEFMAAFEDEHFDSVRCWRASINELLSDSECNLDKHNPKSQSTLSTPPENWLSELRLITESIEKKITTLHDAIASINQTIDSTSSWVEYRLGDFLVRAKSPVDIEDDEEYKRITIKVKGRGISVRDTAKGSSIGTKKQFVVQEGQFVLSKIDARYGAFGVLPEDCDGAIITGNFWAYDVDKTKILPELLKFFTISPGFQAFCVRSSPGATNRRYLQEDLFLVQTVRVPSEMNAQKKFVNELSRIQGLISTADLDILQLKDANPSLLKSALFRVFGGEIEVETDSEIVQEASSE
jgi:type I restriction enzyme M protein